MRHKLRLLNLVLVVVFIFSFTACTTPKTAAETTAQPAIEKGEYNIGETGPAGGLIFYVNLDYKADGWRYLEAAPSNQSEGELWDYYREKDVATGATAIVVGTGKANTQTIVKALGSGTIKVNDQEVAISYAAKLCDDLTLNGYSDWFLPSKDELNLMYVNLKESSLGGFVSDTCWSSSEDEVYNAWNQYFGSGEQYSAAQRKNAMVRAVRSF
jgi:hypothetical protein